ncbi:cordon-bleu protein-like 1 isoform X2 [Poeciliopsis prolifica]|uniref:cordon-bleu protein-like 1 isoform X2 n=1 Tax=Poeciliopsis prolifica TaxID=188132 RepID=UPI002413D408|nr:cordon-bleu protein-like 1 isoform X2 [Poeciliopsis prolifica]
MDEMNPLEREHSLCVVLPAGIEKNITVHGSKPVMDLLVTLCANYHLNPSDHTVEFLSPNKNNISFKPNSPIGLLEAEKILLKPKGTEEKTKKPYMPEATVRLLINYNKSHKTVLRVNPRAPLETVLPAVCDKCELNVETTILLRDLQSKEPLDLTKSLNDHGLREVFAKDTAAQDCQNKTAGGGTPTEVISPTPSQDLQRKERKQRRRGFFSFFRRRKKKNETNGSVSAPTSPGLGKQVRVRGNSESVSSTHTLPADTPKKRPAPQPPVAVSQSVPSNLSACIQGAQSSGELTLRNTKRKAPPPPCANTQSEQREGTDAGESLKILEGLRETDDSLSSSSPSLTRLQEAPDSYRPSFRGRDLSDARSALAKVLTSSVSKGTLVRRLRNSAAFPNFNVASCVSTTSKCLDEGDRCAEHESAFRSNLPTENEWTEPEHRTGWTTFKVVPLKKPASSDQEVMHDTQDCSDLPVIDDKETNEKRKEVDPEDPAPVDGCDNSENQSESGLSPDADVVPCSSCTVGENVSHEEIEEDVSHEEDEEAVFPPPPPPVVFTEDMETVEKEDSQASPVFNGHKKAFSVAHNNASSAASDQPTVAPSRFAQAVALAVQRARLKRRGLGESSGPQASSGPNGTHPSPSRSSYQYGA